MVERRPHGGDTPEEVLDFSASLNPIGPPEVVRRALQEEADLTQYPYELRRTLRQKIAERHEVPPDTILIGSGTSGLIQLLLQALPGERILVPTPTFTEYEDLGKAFNWSVQTDDYFHPATGSRSPEDVRVSDADLLVLCNPNNPTGTLLESTTLEQWLRQARRGDTTLVIDEAYMPFVDPSKNSSLIHEAGERDNVIVLRSFSKFYGIPGLRVGYLVGPEGLVNTVRSRQNPWPVGEPALRGALQCFRARSFRERTREFLQAEKPRVESELGSVSNLRLLESEANFFLFQSPLENLNERLRDHSLHLREASTFSGLGTEWYRMGIRTTSENTRLMEALKVLHGKPSSV